jgi:CheY-like chemotaxis protein
MRPPSRSRVSLNSRSRRPDDAVPSSPLRDFDSFATLVTIPESSTMARITLIATGGVRASTQLELADRFSSDGHDVRCIATNSALRFLVPHLLRHPRGLFRYLRLYRPPLSHDLAYLQKRPRRAPHVDEAAWADVIVVAPATCNSIGKLAAGITDSFPLLVVRAARRATPVIVVPSMNTEMWYDPHFQRSVDLLNETEKYRVLSPTEGQMLGGDVGWGAQVSLDEIVAATYRATGQIDSAIEEVLSGDERHAAANRDGAGSERQDCVVLVDEDEELRRKIASALARELPAIRIEQFYRATEALDWLRTHPVSVVITELTFSEGATGSELIDHFRRLGTNSGVHIIATSREARSKAGAEELARLDVHFQPKPLNVRFLVGLIAGCLHSARKSDVAMTRIHLGVGDVLFREADPGTHLYFVESGLLRVVKQVGGREVTVGTVGANSIVGEMAFLGEGVRSATVVADEPAEVVEVDLDGVRGYLRSQPVWLRVLIQNLTDHLRRLEETVLTAGHPV